LTNGSTAIDGGSCLTAVSGAASATARGGAAGGGAAPHDSSRCTCSANAVADTLAGKCVQCTSRNFSGTRAFASSVASITTGIRNAWSSAIW
jgi:hypothetical protein